jgi:hypothetical protein
MPNDAATDAEADNPSDFYEIMGRFAVARALLSVCHRSLSTNESIDGPADEAEVLAEAIEKLRVVYNEFDTLVGASGQILSKRRRVRRPKAGVS